MPDLSHLILGLLTHLILGLLTLVLVFGLLQIVTEDDEGPDGFA